MTEPVRKKIRANNSQTEHLVDYMARNPQFALGAFTCAMGLQAQNAQWQTLAQELAEIGPGKTVDQWKTSWRDLKCRAKASNAKVNRALSATGNVEEVPSLSTQDKKILGIIGKVTSQGLPGVPESPIGEASLLPTADPAEPEPSPLSQPLSSSQPQAGPSGIACPRLRPVTAPESPRRPRAGPSGVGFPRPHRTVADTPRRPRTRLTGTVADIYSSRSEEQTKILKDIANELHTRNQIEMERNNILKEKNQILAL